jgi:hypothetical protein
MLYGYPKEMFIESNFIKHKYKGWFYDNITKKFYRWNDLMALHSLRLKDNV